MTDSTLLTRCVLLLSAAPGVCLAQGPGGYLHHGSHTQFGTQTSVHTQHPLAALAGSIVGGVGQGLHNSDPGRHAVASGVLGGVGNGLLLASQPTITQQGFINHQQHGGWGAGAGPWNGGAPSGMNHGGMNPYPGMPHGGMNPYSGGRPYTVGRPVYQPGYGGYGRIR